MCKAAKIQWPWAGTQPEGLRNTIHFYQEEQLDFKGSYYEKTFLYYYTKQHQDRKKVGGRQGVVNHFCLIANCLLPIKFFSFTLLFVILFFPFNLSAQAPNIYLGDDPNNPLPCACLDNATTLENGQFRATITIEAPTGQNWTLTLVNGLYNINSPAPPAVPLSLGVGTLIPETQPGSGLYQLNAIHIDAAGFTLTAENELGEQLSIDAMCFYPNPQIVDLATQYCETSLPIPLTGNAEGAVGTGQFFINGAPATIFDPLALGAGSHLVEYIFDAGDASPGNSNDPGCSSTIAQTVVVEAAPNIITNNLINVSLGLNCTANITPDMILEGTYPCIDDDYFVTVYDENGLSIGDTITVDHLGQILSVLVTTAAGGYNGMGSIFVSDGGAPVITDCPDDADFGVVEREIQLLTGAFLNNDPSFMPQNFTCFEDIVNDDNDPHFYKLETFRVTETEIYTFELSATFGTGAGSLYKGAPGSGIGGCQNLVSVSKAIPSGGGFFTGQSGVARITAVLVPDQDYTLLTTSFDGLATGNFTWAVYGEGNGQLENVPSLMGQVSLGLFCGNEIDILNQTASMSILGTPIATDNCVTPNLSIADQLTENGDCVDDFITRTFSFKDESGNTSNCTQRITLAVPTVEDVVLPTNNYLLSCNDPFLMLPNGNPSPIVTGYPFLQTAFGNIELKPEHCNLLATYADRPHTQVCSGTYQFVRRWFLFDDCNPNDDLTYEQTIWVGDVTDPVVSCPAGDDSSTDTLTYPSDALTCTATIDVPLPEVSDDCSNWEVLTQIINEDGLIIGTILPGAANRIVSEIPVGCHRFRYTVTDDCGNASVLECPFCVIDWVEPVAVCDDQLQVSIGANGIGRLYAEDVDEGSTDNCAIDRFEIRRMFEIDPTSCEPISNELPDWAPYVDFYCCEAGSTIMVALRVVDIYGNENFCMTEVAVLDKLAPVCIPPDPVTVDCSDIPPAFNPGDINQLQILFGSPGVEDNCTDAFLEELTPFVSINDCGVGSILRSFEVRDEFGNTASICTQQITIQADPGYAIFFPADVSINCSEEVPEVAEVFFDGCEEFTLTYEDVIFPPTDGACYEILRTYHVINHCEYNSTAPPMVINRDEDCDGTQGEEDVWVVRTLNAAYVDQDDNPFNQTPTAGTRGLICDGMTNPTGHWRTITSTGYWTYNQRIQVFDDQAPTIQFSNTDPFCSYDNETCEGQVDFPFVVTEDCSPDELSIQVFFDAFADGDIDEEVDNSSIIGTYPLFTISDSFPIGTHLFSVRVEDNCGNISVSMLPFEVVDCAIEIPDCLTGLSVTLEALNPPIDIDGDGDIDIASQHIWASDFVFGEVADCSGNVTYSINVEGVVPNIDSISLLVTCEDVGQMPIEIYFWDDAFNPYLLQPDGTLGGPNYDFCTTFITVNDDPVPFCTPPPTGGFIAGSIYTEDDQMVEGVMLHTNASDSPMLFTESDGQYMFDNLDMGQDYTVVPSMDHDYLNGVSTLDLLLLTKHIVGVEPLDSPYKIIAADANRSNTVTTLDLIHLRKLILNITDELSDNTSWRFIDAAFEFPNTNNPWEVPFPEVYNQNDLDHNINNADFIAVKIGDLNGSVHAGSLNELEVRQTAGLWMLDIEDQTLTPGETTRVSLSAKSFETINGFQFTLGFEPSALELVGIESGVLKEENLGLRYQENGSITASWHSAPGEEAPTNQLMTLVFEAQKAGKLSQWLNINSAYTPAEAYSGGDAPLSIGLDFWNERFQVENVLLYQNVPNPFGETTQIGFYLPADMDISLSLYSLDGKQLKEIKGHYPAGENSIAVHGEALASSGMIYYKLVAGKAQVIKRMILLPQQ